MELLRRRILVSVLVFNRRGLFLIAFCLLSSVALSSKRVASGARKQHEPQQENSGWFRQARSNFGCRSSIVVVKCCQRKSVMVIDRFHLGNLSYRVVFLHPFDEIRTLVQRGGEVPSLLHIYGWLALQNRVSMFCHLGKPRFVHPANGSGREDEASRHVCKHQWA